MIHTSITFSDLYDFFRIAAYYPNSFHWSIVYMVNQLLASPMRNVVV